MSCCRNKGNIIIPPIVIMPQPPPLQRQVIPSPCPAKEIPQFIPVNNCYARQGVQPLARYPQRRYPRQRPQQPYVQYPQQPRYNPPPAPGPESDSDYSNDDDYY